MARIVLISPYLKGGQNAAKLAQRTRYFATRPGVELLADEHSTLPATKKQCAFINRLVKSFPTSKELIEYEDYLANPTQGNASADVARTYLLYCLRGLTEEAERYLSLFCKKSDTAKQYVQKWMPIVAASQTVKGNEKEREFLHSWVNVVDYE